MGLYLQVQGQYGTFLYTDPTDSAVFGQAIGFGDGATTAFTLQRTLGEFTEPVSWATGLSQVYFNGVAHPAGWSLASPNTLVLAYAPLGAPSAAYHLGEDNTNNLHDVVIAGPAVPIGTPVTFTIYVQAAEESACVLQINNGASSPYCDFSLSGSGSATPHGVAAQSINAIGGGWYQASITTNMATAAAPAFALGTEGAYGVPTYLGSTGNGVYFAGANWSAGVGAATFLPPFSSGAHATVTPAAIALPGPVAITADFSYAFLCRFIDDQNDFENFMTGLWQVQSLKFRSVKP